MSKKRFARDEGVSMHRDGTPDVYTNGPDWKNGLRVIVGMFGFVGLMALARLLHSL